ncbi:MAG TPA: Rrf2 family transcriptional regulator [Chloroflexota bacterium]|nr:Rrf2 family transcriptional regulator [Chloroflexota bacterium]
MLQVSQRTHYGLRAMTELAKAYGRGPRSLAEVAEAQHLPAGYLEQIATPLRRAGLIDGTRGAHGGYQLARPPDQMSVGEVVRALEGAVAPVECLSEDYPAGSCALELGCLSRPVWQRVKESIDQVLDSTTLADLCATAEAPGCAPEQAPDALGFVPLTFSNARKQDSCSIKC